MNKKLSCANNDMPQNVYVQLMTTDKIVNRLLGKKISFLLDNKDLVNRLLLRSSDERG